MCTIFDPYSPPFGNFLLLSVGKFDQFFTPPPPTLKCWRLKLKFLKGGFAPSWWKLQCYRFFHFLYLKNVHDFDPYSPPVENFLLLSICKFDHFLTPSLKSGRLKLIFSKGGFAPSHWKLQFYQYFAVFKECAWFWPLLLSCWKFFATIRWRIWPVFHPYPPKNVDVLNYVP